MELSRRAPLGVECFEDRLLPSPISGMHPGNFANTPAGGWQADSLAVRPAAEAGVEWAALAVTPSGGGWVIVISFAPAATHAVEPERPGTETPDAAAAPAHLRADTAAPAPAVAALAPEAAGRSAPVGANHFLPPSEVAPAVPAHVAAAQSAGAAATAAGQVAFGAQGTAGFFGAVWVGEPGAAAGAELAAPRPAESQPVAESPAPRDTGGADFTPPFPGLPVALPLPGALPVDAAALEAAAGQLLDGLARLAPPADEAATWDSIKWWAAPVALAGGAGYLLWRDRARRAATEARGKLLVRREGGRVE